MEAVGLASNIIQFVDFAAKLVHTANELRHNASTSENKDHAAIAEHLETIATHLSASAQVITGASTTASAEERTLLPVAQGCCDLAKQLLKRLEACGIREQQSGGRLQRAKRALKCLWNKREIDEISTRLHYFRSELALHMTHEFKHVQAQGQASQASKDDIQGLKASVQALELKTNENLTGILQSMAEVRVDNSRFHLQATQALRGNSAVETSFQHLIRSALEEYEEHFLEGIEKRFRGVAQTEMRNLHESLLLALPKKQAEAEEMSQPTCITDDQEDAMTDQRNGINSQASFQPREHDRYGRPKRASPRKHDINVISKYSWYKCTRFGAISFHVKRYVIFNDDRSILHACSVTAHLIPSPRWLTTGFSVTYQSLADRRGKPTLVLQPETYRILDGNHEVWQVIKRKDTTSLQMMLSQRQVSPSDRTCYGHTLLHVSACWEALDICKILIQDGADVNAQDFNGDTPISYALMPGTFLNTGGSAIFYYLASQPVINLEIFWDKPSENIMLLTSLPHQLLYMKLSDMDEKLNDWIDACLAVECDFVTLGFDTFWGLAAMITRTSKPEDQILKTTKAFDIFLQRYLSGFRSEQNLNTLVGYAARLLTGVLIGEIPLRAGQYWIAATPKPSVCVPYRGYYVTKNFAARLGFLDHVISVGITNRPDCIFHEDDKNSIHNALRICHTKGFPYMHDIWNQILAEHGFDANWVREENERRRRARVGEASAHDASVYVDASEAQKMKRRRPYEHEE